MQYTFASYSFGCRINHAEKQRFDQELLASGYAYNKTNPNIYIINTCTVTSKAEREVRQFIYQTRKKLPKCKIILTGCAATFWQQRKNNNKLPIDLVIPNSDKEKLCETINNFCHPEPFDSFDFTQDKFAQGKLREGSYVSTRQIPQSSRSAGLLRNDKLSHPERSEGSNDKFLQSGRMLLKIQDGCHRFCSYCIVPYLRGKPKSERIQNLESRIQNLDKNIKEVIFTAINTETFGKDTGESLIELIQSILSRTKIPRVSFGSIHPWSIDSKFLDYYKTIRDDSRFVDFFHIPFQSGCNKTLKLMKRDYTVKDLRYKIYELSSINPHALIATDIIVGFLGETDSDFEKTYKLLVELPINKFHIFKFSKRSHTTADFMSKRLTEPTPQQKNERSKRLIALGEKKYQKFLQTLVGWKSSVLLIGDVVNGYQPGLLENQIPVLIRTSKNFGGQIKSARLSQIIHNNIIGELI